MKRKNAFTLVELLVVITIIGILSSLITVAVQGARRAAKRAIIATELNQIATALDSYKKEFGEYPPSLKNDNDLVRHVRKRWPRYTLYSDTSSGISEADAIRSAISKAYIGNNISGVDLNDTTSNVDTGLASLTVWLGGFPNQDGKLSGFHADVLAPFGKIGTSINNGNPSTTGTVTQFSDADFDKKVFIELEMNKQVIIAEASNTRFPCIVNEVSGQLKAPYIYFRAKSSGGQGVYLYEDTTVNPSVYKVQSYGFGSFTNEGWSGMGSAVPYAKSGDPFASSNSTAASWYGADSYQLIHPGLDGKFGNESTSTTLSTALPAFEAARFRSTYTGAAENNIGKDDFDNITNYSKGSELKTLTE